MNIFGKKSIYDSKTTLLHKRYKSVTLLAIDKYHLRKVEK
jgi:hypothetical protein